MSFASLQPFRRIFVTGPHRSGTRIAARMIANDTGHFYADETAVWDSPIGVKAYSEWHPTGCVFHAPLLMHRLPEICTAADYVVLVKREPNECERSARRIGISQVDETRERQEWAKFLPIDLESAEPGPAAAFKYAAWNSQILPRLSANVVTIEYDELRGDPLWRDDRQNWRWDQTGPANFGSPHD